jgi:hypothetical protein
MTRWKPVGRLRSPSTKTSAGKRRRKVAAVEMTEQMREVLDLTIIEDQRNTIIRMRMMEANLRLEIQNLAMMLIQTKQNLAILQGAVAMSLIRMGVTPDKEGVPLVKILQNRMVDLKEHMVALPALDLMQMMVNQENNLTVTMTANLEALKTEETTEREMEKEMAAERARDREMNGEMMEPKDLP